MNKSFYLCLLLGLICLLPTTASAQVPPDCMRRHGEIKCDIPRCRQFCGGPQRGPHGPNHAVPAPAPRPGHNPPPPAARPHPVPPPQRVAHPAPVPPQPPVVHPAPVPPPHPVAHPAPVPPPPPHDPGLIGKRDRLMADNDRLLHDRDIAIAESDHAYETCLHMPHPLSMHCTRPMADIRRIEHKIERNNREIERINAILSH